MSKKHIDEIENQMKLANAGLPKKEQGLFDLFSGEEDDLSDCVMKFTKQTPH